MTLIETYCNCCTSREKGNDHEEPKSPGSSRPSSRPVDISESPLFKSLHILTDKDPPWPVNAGEEPDPEENLGFDEEVAGAVAAPIEDGFELYFRDLDFYKVDHDAFKAELKCQFRDIGVPDQTINQIKKISLRPGSVIANVIAPTPAISEFKSSPIKQITVMGCKAKVDEPQAVLEPQSVAFEEDAQVEEEIGDDAESGQDTSPASEAGSRPKGRRVIRRSPEFKKQTVELFKHPAFQNMREKARRAQETAAEDKKRASVQQLGEMSNVTRIVDQRKFQE